MGGARRQCRVNKDEVHAKCHKLGRKLGEAIEVFVNDPPVYVEIFTLHVPKILELFQEHCRPRGVSPEVADSRAAGRGRAESGCAETEEAPSQ